MERRGGKTFTKIRCQGTRIGGHVFGRIPTQNACGSEDPRAKGFTPSGGMRTTVKSNPPFHLMRLYLAWLLASRVGITRKPRQPLVLIRAGRAKPEGCVIIWLSSHT